MIRVPFNKQIRPPAPFVSVSIGDPIRGTIAADLPAQTDTAADRTLIPLAVVEALGMQAIDQLPFGGLGGIGQWMPLYAVSLAVRTMPAREIAVVAHARESWILLGRDVLNSYRIVLDGPNAVLELA